MSPLPRRETEIRDCDLSKICPRFAVSLLCLSVIYSLGTYLHLRRKKNKQTKHQTSQTKNPSRMWNSYPHLPPFLVQSVIVLLSFAFSERHSRSRKSRTVLPTHLGIGAKKPLCSKFTPNFYNNFHVDKPIMLLTKLSHYIAIVTSSPTGHWLRSSCSW